MAVFGTSIHFGFGIQEESSAIDRVPEVTPFCSYHECRQSLLVSLVEFSTSGKENLRQLRIPCDKGVQLSYAETLHIQMPSNRITCRFLQQEINNITMVASHVALQHDCEGEWSFGRRNSIIVCLLLCFFFQVNILIQSRTLII